MTRTKSVTQKLCECGCGGMTWNRFVSGHNTRFLTSEDQRKRGGAKENKPCLNCYKVWPIHRNNQFCKPLCKAFYFAHERHARRTYMKWEGRHLHVVMAELYVVKRPLTDKEVVHHIDGDIYNCMPDNLEVLASQGEHARIHHTSDRRCSVEGCDRKHDGRGLCSLHRQLEVRRAKGVQPRSVNKKCTVEGCEKTYLARGFCSIHYQRARWRAKHS